MRRGTLVIRLLAALACWLPAAVADAKPKRLPPQKGAAQTRRAPERMARRDDGLVGEPKGITWIVRPGQRSEGGGAGKSRPARVRAEKRSARNVGPARSGRVARGRAR